MNSSNMSFACLGWLQFICIETHAYTNIVNRLGFCDYHRAVNGDYIFVMRLFSLHKNKNHKHFN